MLIGDLVRIQNDHRFGGMTGVCERIGIQDADVRLTATGVLCVVPLYQLRRIIGTPTTIETTQARRGAA